MGAASEVARCVAESCCPLDRPAPPFPALPHRCPHRLEPPTRVCTPLPPCITPATAPERASAPPAAPSMAAPASFAAMAAKVEQKKAPLKTVQLEGQVVLKIAKHCKEAEGQAISTGQLLGLDVGSTLEVTDCFPYPVRRRRRPRRRASGPGRMWSVQCVHKRRRRAVLSLHQHYATPPPLPPRVVCRGAHCRIYFAPPACRATRARSTRRWVRARATSWR